MADLLRLVVDLAGLLFPFRIVHTWERGLLFVFGRCVRTVLPAGVYPILPWFTDIRPISVVPSVHQTPVQTIGGTTFSLSLVLRVFDPWAAWNTLEAWSESSVELASAVAAAYLRDSAGSEPDTEEMRGALNDELRPHGVEVLRLRFNDYVVDAPVVRLLSSQGGMSCTNVLTG
jgi:regulator of protease activity HflC (stomatin/prohibitin superfamily)